jgi:hypothetical protein
MATLEQSVAALNRQTEERNAQALAVQYGLSYANLQDEPIGLEALDLFSIEEMRAKGIACYLRTPGVAKIGIVHPENKTLISELELQQRVVGVRFELVVISQNTLDSLIDRALLLASEREAAIKATQEHSGTEYVSRISHSENLGDALAVASTTEGLDILVATGYAAGASGKRAIPS